MVRRVEPVSRSESSRSESSIDRWLDILTRLLRLSPTQRDAIREELAEHLHERVRDLMLTGVPEENAVATAIEELGETADLAQRFRAASRYRTRRIVMHLTTFAVGLGVLGLGLASLQSSGPAPAPVPARVYEQMPDAPAPPAALESSVEVDFRDLPLAEVVERLAAITDLTFYVHWNDLADYGIDRQETRVNLQARRLPVRQILSLLLEELGDSGEELGWSFSPELVELGLRHDFERRDIVLTSYDISAVVQSLGDQYDIEYHDAVDQIVHLLSTVVAPDSWMDNGGDLAHVNVVGGRMFIEAPRNMHRRIAWVLAQLADGVEQAAQRSPDAMREGDLVTVQVYELFAPMQWATITRRIGRDGKLRVPQVGDVEAASLTPEQLEERIRRIMDAEVMADPQVIVLREDERTNLAEASGSR